MNNDFKEFCKNFNIVNNALKMRTLWRWNGRDLREHENLSEHTHLVVACAIELYDRLNKMPHTKDVNIQFEQMTRICMLHDSVELLRGDILSITKDKIPFLRNKIDNEENKFIEKFAGNCNDETKEVVRLADLMACYKFVEYELRYPSNDFAAEAYKETKNKFDVEYNAFLIKYGYCTVTNETEQIKQFCKGYAHDAGIDVTLRETVVFMPMSTSKVNLKIQCTPVANEMSFLCSRTSAAAKGIIVSMCPIDPDYTGDVTAIVHNISNDIITYERGTAFCQLVSTPTTIARINENVFIKKKGVRTDGKLGSTDKV